MTRSLRSAAQAGDIKALETLMNQAFAARGATVKVGKTTSVLVILITTARRPSPGLPQSVQRGLDQIRPQGVEQVFLKVQSATLPEQAWTTRWRINRAGTLPQSPDSQLPLSVVVEPASFSEQVLGPDATSPDATSGAAPPPWWRGIARLFDSVCFAWVIGICLALIPLLELVGSLYFAGLVLFLYVFVEPLLLSTWGTTPGKAWLGICLRQPHGSRLGYRQAWQRAFWVFVVGLGFGLPGISLVTGWMSYEHLKHHGTTYWDRRGGVKVSYQAVGRRRVGALLGVLACLIGAGGVLGALVL